MPTSSAASTSSSPLSRQRSEPDGNRFQPARPAPPAPAAAAHRVHDVVTSSFDFEALLTFLVQNEQRFRVVMHCKPPGLNVNDRSRVSTPDPGRQTPGPRGRRPGRAEVRSAGRCVQAGLRDPEAVRGEAGPDGAADQSLSGRTHDIEGTEPLPVPAIELIGTSPGISLGGERLRHVGDRAHHPRLEPGTDPVRT